MDDLIGMLNNGAPVAAPCRPRAAEKEDFEHEKRSRELKIKQQQEMEMREAEEARQRLQKQQHEEKQQQALERARRLEAKRSSAAVLIQSFVRRLQAKREAVRRREERHQREAAAVLMQAAIKARAARCHLHELRVEAFRRRCAVRRIADGYLRHRSQWRLNPVQGPVRGSPEGGDGLDSHAHLLEKPLRLRSMADARLAPEVASALSGSAGSEPLIGPQSSGKRTLASARVRVGQIMQDQGRLRDEAGARALMAVSEHRDLTAAMQVVKAGGRPVSN